MYSIQLATHASLLVKKKKIFSLINTCIVKKTFVETDHLVVDMKVLSLPAN